jgi:hypothetical protein
MTFAAAVGHRSGRATPSLRDAPQRQSMEIVGRETIYRNRNAVQTNPATSLRTLDLQAAAWVAWTSEKVDQDRPDPEFDAMTSRMLRREALRRAAEELNTMSGPGLEGILARISAEVTAEGYRAYC